MKAKIIIGLCAVLVGIILFANVSFTQSVPQLINYQGRLTDTSGQPLDATTVDLTFTFYSAAFGGTVYISVLQNDVLVTSGLYNVLVGSGTVNPGTETSLSAVFQNHQDVWMGVKVNSDPEMTPRSRITSVPFAMSVDIESIYQAAFYNSDHDGDGHKNPLVGGNDCNDGNSAIHPGAVEVACDGIDQDCNGQDYMSAEKIGPDIRVTNDPGYSYFPSLAWTGSGFGVSWHDDRDGNAEIYFALLDATGTKLTSDQRITSEGSHSFSPSLAWNGSEFMVVWADHRDSIPELFLSRIDSSGSKISEHRITSDDSGLSDCPSISWTGSELGVSWTDDRDFNNEIYFIRVSTNGDTVGNALRVTSANAQSEHSSLVWTGSEFGVSWVDFRDDSDDYCDPGSSSSDCNFEIYFARISAAGVKIGSDQRITSDSAESRKPSLAWTGSEFGVSWEDMRDDGDDVCDEYMGTMDCNWEIYFARISSAGSKIGADLRITTDITENMNPDLQWNGSEFWLAWDDNRDGNMEIYSARIEPSGVKMGADQRITWYGANSYSPSLAWTGSVFGVSWYDFRHGSCEIYFARVGGVCP